MSPYGRPGGGTPLFCLNGSVLPNRVWFSGFYVLNRVYNFAIKRLKQGVFLDRKPWTGCDRRVVFMCGTNFLKKI